ncbi:MAG: elongation factor G, partial [Patescibacteria group bacterium]
CFINKLDRTGASFERSYASILDRLTKNAVRMQIPIGEEDKHEGVIDLLTMKAYDFEGEKGKDIKEIPIPADLLETAKKYHNELIEKIVETDETAMGEYLDGKEISVDRLKKLLRTATIKVQIVPVFAGSALKNKGVQLVLDGVVDYLPSPVDIPPAKGIDPNTGEDIFLEQRNDAPLSALAFKLAADPFVGQLTFLRIYSGTIRSGSYVYNASKNERERVGRLVRMHANEREEVKEAYAGEIVAAVGLKSTLTSDTLCDEDHPIILEKIVIPEPVISMRIEPKTKADQEKMGLALKKLSDEDPTFRIRSDAETNEVIIAGMGELHLEIIVDRMKREFNVEANTGKPQVAYRETITGEAEEEHKYIKQTGGKGQYGHVKIQIRPIDYSEEPSKNTKRYNNFEFTNAIKGGVIPQEFIPAVEKGLVEGLSRGVLAGFPLVNVSVTLIHGSYHDVDSSEIAFKLAASMAVQDACKKARPVILEPVMKMEVITPDKFMGDITGNLNSKRGQIESMEDRGQYKVIRAKVPLSEMFGYVTQLRSMTEGRASSNMEFAEYAIVPKNVADTIITSRK